MLSGNGWATPPAALRCSQNRRLTVERIGFPLDNLCSTPLAALIWRCCDMFKSEECDYSIISCGVWLDHDCAELCDLGSATHVVIHSGTFSSFVVAFSLCERKSNHVCVESFFFGVPFFRAECRKFKKYITPVIPNISQLIPHYPTSFPHPAGIAHESISAELSSINMIR